MPTSNSQRASRREARPINRTLTVCIVDTHSEDYREWVSMARSRGLCLQILTSAEQALRLARTHTVALWVVNTDLPGLSGHELCGMLKARDSQTPVYLVADAYSPEAERAAWQSRATLFGCKGAHVDWLHDWLQTKSVASQKFC